MIKKDIIYDTDCLSCFISIDDVSILKQLFKKIIIPYEVYKEFSKVPVLKRRVDRLIKKGFIEVIDLNTNTSTYNLFVKLHRGYIFNK